ncbi:MAG: hypothetical protein GF393_10010 [Armatimonadia bacterium]|nr:hypothetical protein [Armatimonadia bacterium]
MGKRGPARTSKRELERRGSWRAKDREDDFQPQSGMPRMPAGLDSVAKTEWRRIINEHDGAGTLARIDESLLEQHCRLWSRLRSISHELDAMDPRSKDRPQLAKEAKEVHTQLQFSWKAFGIGIANRTRVEAPKKPKGKDASSAYFNSQGESGKPKLVG